MRVAWIALLLFTSSGLFAQGAGTIKGTVIENGKETTYELCMPEDADPDKGMISVASPVGRAFVGKEEGDEVVVVIPAGKRTFEIVRLRTIHDES